MVLNPPLERRQGGQAERMSLEAHHRFILDTMQRNQDIARNIINELEAENARLKAEVERLRKHGDAMAEALEAAGFNNARDFWNAAKEGKPHA
jgi:cell division protein FtsB